MTDPSSPDADAPQPDDEQPVTATPDERRDERQPKPDHDLVQDDELRAGQFGPTP